MSIKDRELQNFSDEELLLELIERKGLIDSPKRRVFQRGDKVCVVGIGEDHFADVIINENVLPVLRLLCGRDA